MIEQALSAKQLKPSLKITVKTALSALLVVLSVALPQLIHIVAGASGGMTWLPMYLPVVIGGCLLGVRYGLGIAVLAPVFSFAVTSLAGNPMPALARLPFIVAELAVFASVSGMFTKKIAENKLLAFPAVFAAQIAGRTVFLALAALLNVSGLNAATAWTQIKVGLPGLLLQAAIAPAVIILSSVLMQKKRS